MNKRFFNFIIATMVAAFAFMLSCKEDNNDGNKDIALVNVAISRDSVKLSIGSPFQFEYAITPKDATINPNVIWVSHNPEIAHIDTEGVMTPISVGETRVTITVSTPSGVKMTRTCDVRVVEPDHPVQGVDFYDLPEPDSNGDIKVIAIDAPLQLYAQITPDYATNQDMVWSSSNTGIATVDAKTGLVTAVSDGKTMITVTTMEGPFARAVEITVDLYVSVTNLTIISAVNMEEGAERTLIATIEPENATNKTLLWDIDEAGEDVIEIEQVEAGDYTRYLVKALSVGTATITVTSECDDAIFRNCVVTVSEPSEDGADFSNAVFIAEYPGNTSGYYATATNARYASVDLEHVLISGRELLEDPFLLKLSDLRQGILAPTYLRGVGSDQYRMSVGNLVHGRVYVCNLNLNGTSLNIYHWDKTKPEEDDVTTITLDADEVGGTRTGDAMSIDLDNNGNGYIFLPYNTNVSTTAVRLTVSNFTDIIESVFVRPLVYLGYLGHFHKVEGSTNEYIYSGMNTIDNEEHSISAILVNEDGETLKVIPAEVFPNRSGVGMHIFNFNNARYLAALNTTTTDLTIAVYDISNGATTLEALDNFINSEDREPAYTYSFGVGVTATSFAADISIAKDGDNKLYIAASGTQAGFVVIEIPKK